ncbi:MAG: DrmE family protein [Candidatus Daviesbacteria bacterium]|nr:DrmE family protein [Candidatus Daviesbacteria bacterium]
MNDTTNSWTSSLDIKDGLYKKLSSSTEGWNINLNGQLIDVPLNEIDALAYQILQKTLTSKKRIAIALPRVKSGVSLSIIAYLVINRFLKRQQDRILEDFIPLQLNNGQSVIIATKNRKLRDFFLESGLKFNHSNFLFTHFPIYRIDKQGKMVPLVSREDSMGQIKMDPVIFYHFDSLDTLPLPLQKGYFIGELSETDSPDITSRLCHFIKNTKAESALVLVNKYSYKSIDILKKNDFHIITLSIKDILNKTKITKDINLPSLGSSLSICSPEIKLRITLIENTQVVAILNRILQILMSLNDLIKFDRPFILIKAWGLFYSLKDLAVPLVRLEEYRKKNPWLKTISHNMEQTFNFPIQRLDQNIRRVLDTIWPTLGSEFKKLYEILKNQSVKYDYLLNLVNKLNKSEETWHVVFCSSTQAKVLNEELLLHSDVEEDSSKVKVGFINDYINNSEICENLILVGFWKKSEQAKILSLFPKVIHLLAYSFELSGLPGTIYNLNNDPTYESTIDSLNSIGIKLSPKPSDSIPYKWLLPDNESQILLSHIKDIIPVPTDMSFPFEEDKWNLFEIEERLQDDTEISGEILEGSDADDETIASYQIELENGQVIFIPVEQEIYVYTDGEDSIHLKLPETLAEGDVILLYSDEQNQEMFKNVLNRTQELSKVDSRVISLWQTALKGLRETYDISNPYSVNAYLHDLKDNGCVKIGQTVRQWLKGTTFAPRDIEDIECLLKLAEIKNSSSLSKIIHGEIESTRVFNRRMGKRLRERLGIKLNSDQNVHTEDAIDREIDEILEMVQPNTIRSIIEEVKNVPKEQVRLNVFG